MPGEIFEKIKAVVERHGDIVLPGRKAEDASQGVGYVWLHRP